jgi:putative ABC transport system permease protein
MLRIAFRRLFRHRPFVGALQIAGLGIGLASFALIAQFVFFESSFDRSNPNREHLCRVGANIYREGELHLRSAITYLDLGPSLLADFPGEVEAFARLAMMGGEFKIGDKTFLEERLFYTDAVFPTLFNLEMISGDPRSALAEPGAMLLNESTARRFFGTADCLGQALRFECMFPQKHYVVRGVFRDLPQNSHLQSHVFLSMKSLTDQPGVLEKWAWRDFVNYVLLKPGVSEAQFAQKTNRTDYVGGYWPRYPERHIRHELFFQKIANIHLGPRLDSEFAVVGNAKTVRILSLLGLFLLLVSVVNFVLLALAKSGERSKEIGIRKTIGAGKTSLVGQFLLENLPILSISGALAAGLVWAAQPFLADLTGTNLPFTFFENPVLLAATVGVFTTILLFGNLLPAFAMSRFAPVGLLRSGQTQAGSGGGWQRKSLVVFQFSVAVFMMVATLVVWRQIQFLLHRDTGLNLDQTIVLRFPNDRSPEVAAKISTLKTTLLQHPDLRSATASMSVPGDGGPWVPSIRKFSETGGVGASRVIHLNAVDADFIPAYGLKLLAGRNFNPAIFPEPDALILTETAARALGFPTPEHALNQRFICAGDTVSVIGVSSDYSESGGQRLPPESMFVQRTDEIQRLSLRVETRDMATTLAAVQQTWEQIFTGSTFDYFFLDQHFAALYDAEVRFGKIAGLFAALAILIACLGLFGSSALVISTRTKEIGIRKVLGASVAGITGLLARDFLKLVLVAIGIASPVAYYFMQRWLADFAYRIDIQWWMFVAAGAAAVAIAFLTVGFQSVRAALANPVKSLRSA